MGQALPPGQIFPNINLSTIHAISHRATQTLNKVEAQYLEADDN
jgi:hypothetical protein